MGSFLGGVLAVGHQLAQLLPEVLAVGVASHRVALLLDLAVDDLVDGEPEGVVEHAGDELAEQRTGALDAGVLVDLDEPHLELAVDEEVEPEDLEAVPALVLVDLLLDRAEGHVGDLLDPAPDPAHLLLGHELRELPEGELVGVFELAVVGGMLLDGVVGEVDEVVVDVLGGEGLGGGADVALAEEVDVHRFGQQRPHADVELPAVYQERPLHVLLDDERTRVQLELLGGALRLRVGRLDLGGLLGNLLQRHRFLELWLAVMRLLLLRLVGLIGLFLELLAVHEEEVVEQDLLELLDGVEDLDAASAVESGGFE